MKIIHCISKTEYKRCPITILHFDYEFIYLFVHNGKFYFDHIEAPASLVNRVKWWIGKWQYPFSQEEMVKIKETVLNGAIRSIDGLDNLHK